MPKGLVVLVTGVSGSGKTTIGRLLADRLSIPFIDADDFHSQDSRLKMHKGIPLTETDRLPWLRLIAEKISHWLTCGERIVLACSALEESQRHILVKNKDYTPIIFLHGKFELIQQRLAKRAGHFFNMELLPSQFAILQEPKDAINLDISLSPEVLVEQALEGLRANLRNNL